MWRAACSMPQVFVCGARFFRGHVPQPDQIAYVLTVVGVVTVFDQRLDPIVLLVRQCDGFANGRHGMSW